MKAGESRHDGAPRRVAVIGASAGGVEALLSVVRGLSADVPAAFVVVTHMPADAESRLPAILDRAGPLSARPAMDGAKIEPGVIHVAPPDRHTIISGGRVWLVDGPRENRVRPALDPLFRSAAREYREQTVGVVLSGTGDDGTAGLTEIAAVGGTTIVQDPDDSLATGMPRAAMSRVRVDHVAAAAEIGPLLTRIAHDSPPAGAVERPVPTRKGAPGRDVLQGPGRIGPPTDISCPACGGVLRDASFGSVERYRCRIGHTFSAESLLEEQRERLEDALWIAVRALEEQAVTAGRLAERSRERGIRGVARRFEDRQREAAEQADVVRSAIRTVAQVPVGEEGTRPGVDAIDPESGDPGATGGPRLGGTGSGAQPGYAEAADAVPTSAESAHGAAAEADVTADAEVTAATGGAGSDEGSDAARRA